MTEKRPKRKLTRSELIDKYQDIGVKAMGIRVKQIAKAFRRYSGRKPWYSRQRLEQLDARVLAHGGRTGAGITRPIERREGDPPYRDRADAVRRRWLPMPEDP
jgi:hypothetical protein